MRLCNVQLCFIYVNYPNMFCSVYYTELLNACRKYTLNSHFNHNAFSNFNENKLFLYNTKQINIHVAHRLSSRTTEHHPVVSWNVQQNPSIWLGLVLRLSGSCELFWPVTSLALMGWSRGSTGWFALLPSRIQTSQFPLVFNTNNMTPARAERFVL